MRGRAGWRRDVTQPECGRGATRRDVTQPYSDEANGRGDVPKNLFFLARRRRGDVPGKRYSDEANGRGDVAKNLTPTRPTAEETHRKKRAKDEQNRAKTSKKRTLTPPAQESYKVGEKL